MVWVREDMGKVVLVFRVSCLWHRFTVSVVVVDVRGGVDIQCL